MLDSERKRERLRMAKAFFNNGEVFRSYDLAVDAMKQWPEETSFAHLAVLSLANAGATDRAMEKYLAFELDRCVDQEARTLFARLKKDQGFAASGELRRKLHQEARARYEEAYLAALTVGNPEAYYPGINAAALALWTGDRESARRIARQVLAGITSSPIVRDDSDDLYWLRATELEAHLILGDLDKVRSMSAEVLAIGAKRYAQIATTGRQLRRIAESMGISPDFLPAFTPPSIVHFTGHIVAAPGRLGRFDVRREKDVSERIQELLEAENVGSGYGSLAAGADILVAEALLARGAALHVVLPFPFPEFLEQSVRSAGASWVERSQACLEMAKTVRYATEDSFLDDESLFRYTGKLGMGLAVLAARHLQAPVMQIAVWDGEARGGASGTVADMKAWSDARLQQKIVLCGSKTEADDLAGFVPPESTPRGHREILAMMFCDMAGFSKLREGEFLRFAEHIGGQLGTVTRSFREDIAFVNTWGDAIFAVFADVAKAASWALHLQSAMQSIDFAGVGLPAHLKLRLGGHLGPVYQFMDPVIERMNYYGTHVNRAARIEPVAPPGCAYVTETFAAALALRSPGEFACDYVGFTETAKNYGRLRIFLLRSASETIGPVVISDIEQAPLEGFATGSA